jgi:hypothetical protein
LRQELAVETVNVVHVAEKGDRLFGTQRRSLPFVPPKIQITLGNEKRTQEHSRQVVNKIKEKENKIKRDGNDEPPRVESSISHLPCKVATHLFLHYLDPLVIILFFLLVAPHHIVSTIEGGRIFPGQETTQEVKEEEVVHDSLLLGRVEKFPPKKKTRRERFTTCYASCTFRSFTNRQTREKENGWPTHTAESLTVIIDSLLATGKGWALSFLQQQLLQKRYKRHLSAFSLCNLTPPHPWKTSGKKN